jgi:hypothetical protein
MSVKISQIRNKNFYYRNRNVYVTGNNLRTVYYQAKIAIPIAADM